MSKKQTEIDTLRARVTDLLEANNEYQERYRLALDTAVRAERSAREWEIKYWAVRGFPRNINPEGA